MTRVNLVVAGNNPAQITHPRQRDESPKRSHQSVSELLPPAERLQKFVYEHGAQYDSYLATEPDCEVFWSTDSRGVISFAQVGRHALVRGGLVAPSDHKHQLLQEFLNHTARINLRPVFFCISENDLPIFREFGYRITKLGEDAIVDLGGFEFRGKKYEWVRRQANYCKRQGVVASEVSPNLMPAEEWQATLNEILEISQDSLADKAQKEELRFFDGRIGEHKLGLRRLFVARSDGGKGRIEGFIVCNPMNNGRVWSTEIYRHRPDAVRGVVTFLMQFLIYVLQDEGVEKVNLCIVPGRNCNTQLRGDNPLVRHALRIGRKYFSVIFDLSGIDHYKSRFRPRYENRYLCTPQKPALGAFVATFKVFGVFRLDYLKTASLIRQRIRKHAARKSLSAGN